MPTLGCGQHTAYVQGKCAGPRLCELNANLIHYNRILDDVSEAYVEVPVSGADDDPCCTCLADVEPWCHVLTIVREGEGVVWTGPIQRVVYSYNKVRIEAKDKLEWLKVRVNEVDIDEFLVNTTIPLTEIAAFIAEVAMADDGDSPCFLDCIIDQGDGLPAGTDRSRAVFKAYDGPTAFDDFQLMADSGVDYTVVGQCLILGPEKIPTRAIGTLTDEMILGEIEVTKDGNLLGNRFFVRYEGDDDCVGVCAPQGVDCAALHTSACPAVAETSEADRFCYGLVERIQGDLELNSKSSAFVTAETFLNANKVIPRTIEFKDGTRLSPETPWTLEDMIPGQRMDVALTKLCLPVFQSFKIQEVSVDDTASGETISISLKALERVPGTE